MFKKEGIVQKVSTQFDTVSMQLDNEWWRADFKLGKNVDFTKFNQGDQVEIQYIENQGSNGKTYKNVTSVTKLDGSFDTKEIEKQPPTPTRTNATISSNEVMMASIGIWTRSAPSICKTVDDVKTYNSAMIDYFKNNLSNGQ